ncbi:transmembrane protein 45A-like [Triticum dicoccoides]|uniref:transmembrane protein 45A-like n=1 Tax=Triticum dicoccoides TaxID=85692 RepID=UPI000E79F38F|nr:transmembrane protein 45A-like [Triticum dicoccoides]
MGSFYGHVLPGTLFLAVGLWRVWSAVARFAADPAAFRVRAWCPLELPRAPRLLELYVVAGGTFLDMCLELGGGVLAGRGDGVAPESSLIYLEHAGMLLMFFLFGALALLSQKRSRYLPLTDGELCLVAAAAFTSEFLLFSYHSATHAGLEGYYHHLLVILIGLCILSTVLGDVAAGMLMALQGLWFYQTALTLYGPMLPAGCDRDASGHQVDCHSRAAGERAEQLANFQLFGAVFLAFVYVLGCYAVAAAMYGHPDLAAMHEEHVAALECRGGAEECVV